MFYRQPFVVDFIEIIGKSYERDIAILEIFISKSRDRVIKHCLLFQCVCESSRGMDKLALRRRGIRAHTEMKSRTNIIKIENVH